ncbi:MAG: ATP-binding protein [Paludisphaera borealis]|uniref:ATP-binding protein n=1 Tax=Paludisphaera borealis TaxID=1387353 RepID=UPI00283E7A60|nr:ATP-binding protein [Paludisphaera borealis]MDR3621884.1 ATP-binding protein [Paludisphaera borealis]
MIELCRDAIRDPERLAVLRSTRLLDTEAEPAFDRLTRLAARVLHAPAALIAVVDADRQFLKSAFGLSAFDRGSPRPDFSRSFTEFIVRSGRPLVVRDATNHGALGCDPERSEVQPIACLGVPLTAARCQIVGAFCVIDLQARAWTDADLQALQELADAATWEMRSRAEKAELIRSQRRSALLHATASILAEASTLDAAIAPILRTVGEFLDCEAAECWSIDGSDFRRSTRDWFSRESGRLYLKRSREANQAPRWIATDSAGTVDLSGSEASAFGLSTAFVAPVESDGRRFGTLAFLGRESAVFDESLGPVLSDLGREIGRFAARRERDDEVREFAALLDQSSEMIVFATPGGRIRHLNSAGRELAGYRGSIVPEDLRIGDLLPQYDVLAAASEPFSDRRWSGQTVLKRPRTGREIDVDASLFLVRDPVSARPLGMAAIVRDARARTRDEALLLGGKARLRGVLEASLDALVTLDHQGDVIEFNPAAERIFGVDTDATLGRRFAELIAADDQRAAFEASLRAYIETRSSPSLGERREIEARRGDGTRFPAELTVAAVHLDGPPVFTASLRDISRQKQTEGELRRARDEALASSQAKAAFLANMSHEVRTPMSAVLGYADMLLDPALPAADRQAAIQAIRRNGSHLLQIINDILDLSKIEAGRMRLDPVACSPWQVALEVVSGLRVRGDERGIVLDVEASGPLPESATMDPTRVRQILVNLVGNAIKFSEPGGRVSLRLTARHGASSREGVLRLEVEDRGVGIPADQLEGIFTPFQQADSSSTRKFGGTGLGLSISRRLAEAMGGGIDVQSTLGEGSRFAVELPLRGVDPSRRWLAPGELTRRVASENEAVVEPIGGALAGRVLLVEDSPDNQRVLLYHLNRMGVEVETAGDGRTGVDRALGGGFDLVLMDMQLPVLDGYGAAGELRRAGFEKPIIALTAHAMSEDRGRCLRSGCTEYLTKPVDVRRLYETLAQQLSIRASDSPPVVSRYAADSGLAALVRKFVASLPGKVARFREAVAANDLAEIESQAHQLRGVGTMYGFPAVTETCALVEAAVREGRDLDLIAELVEEFADLCERIGRGVDEPRPEGSLEIPLLSAPATSVRS